MKTLLCSVPDGSLRKTLQPLIPPRKDSMVPAWLPFGILHILSWMEKNGHSSDLYDTI